MQLNVGGSPILNRDSKRQWIFLPISLVPEIFYFILHFEVKKNEKCIKRCWYFWIVCCYRTRWLTNMVRTPNFFLWGTHFNPTTGMWFDPIKYFDWKSWLYQHNSKYSLCYTSSKCKGRFALKLRELVELPHEHSRAFIIF